MTFIYLNYFYCNAQTFIYGFSSASLQNKRKYQPGSTFYTLLPIHPCTTKSLIFSKSTQIYHFLEENSMIYSFQWQQRMTELSSNAIILMWFQTCQRSYIRKLYNTNCKKSCIVNLGKTKKKHKVKPKSHFEKYIFEHKGLSVLFLFHLLCIKTAFILIFVSLNST